MYQPTSWEYVQFLVLANDGSLPFLAQEGQNLLDAWLATGMAAPVAMTTETWDASCNPALATYCTAKPSSLPNCVPAISFSGTPSASAGSGFTVSAGPVPGSNQGLWIYTTFGAAQTPIQNAFGHLCIATQGLFRIAAQTTGGNAGSCNGQLALDFNQYAFNQTHNAKLVVGATVDLQAWYRDPPNPGGANLTGAGSFVLCP
jgi:hypothetical protein